MSYTAKIVRLNADADQSLLGVQLGRLCIYRQVPVADVAEALNVTKAAVYRWFSGKRDVSKHLRERVLAYYRSTLPRREPHPASFPGACRTWATPVPPWLS